MNHRQNLFRVPSEPTLRARSRTVVRSLCETFGNDLVRLTGKGIAGSKIEIKVDGPAKVEASSTVREFVDGRPVIGNSVTEFDLKPTGTGKVTATITVTPPQPDAKAKVTKVEFDVK